MTNILVTGSSGFIGKPTCNELAARGMTAIPYDLPSSDIRDVSALREIVRLTDVQGIINLAGMLGTPELFGHEAKAAEVNIIGAINVYDVASEVGIPVVQVGTGHKGQPNPYALTKACAEDLGLARAQWLGHEVTILRAYHVYGPGQPVGPPHGTASVHKFFPTFATRALTNMPLELCGTGEQLIDTVYVDDVAVALVDALAGPYGTVVEAGNGVPISVDQVAQDILSKIPTSSSTITTVAGRSGEPRDAVVVATKPVCNNLWPYKATETIEWYQEWLTSSR